MDDKITIQSADATELSLPIAGVGSRSYAFIIDWHIRFILALAWFFIVYLLHAALGGIDFDFFFDDSWGLVTYLPAGLIYFLYHPVLEVGMQGRTPGKRMAGVRIVAMDGRTPGAGALLLRNVFRLVDSLPSVYMVGMAACIFTKNAVRIGDMAAGTLLVEEQQVGNNDLENVSALANHAHYSPEHLEILQNLLLRWKDMDPPSRVRLSEQLLGKMQVPLPAQTAAHVYGNSLHERLLAVQQGQTF